MIYGSELEPHVLSSSNTVKSVKSDLPKLTLELVD